MNNCAPGLALVPSTEPLTWQARVEERLCAGWPGSQFLFGGFGMAGCLDAMERASGLPATVAACHFLSPARPDEVLTYAVTVPESGSVRQALVVVRCGERIVARMLGVAGARGEQARLEPSLPIMTSPAGSRPISIARLMSSNVHDLFEARLVNGQIPDRPDWTCDPEPNCQFWVKPRQGGAPSRRTLAAIGDFVGMGIPGALGTAASGTSLDNHIRIVRDAPGEWVLCEVTIDAVAAGLLHGRIVMHDEEGAPLAMGSQTMLVRRGT